MSTSWLNSAFATVARSPRWIHGSLAAAGGLLYLKVWLPATGLGIPCVFHEATGLYCPGCGMTRAALSLLEGDLPQAFRYNALAFGLLPLLFVYFLANRRGMRRTSRAVMAAMVTAALAFGVTRNLPAWAWLSPTAIGS
ncbi:DUF2752 domain-containing protein [Paenibacillus sp.]|uniref:DUF2752 domain-containing protein n=1 Tax=Paenibacillus sp. TaxID=58172 RepID=UPI00281167E6|nr:DUF2752 domain-containing protein [Paenibacillus sp.]